MDVMKIIAFIKNIPRRLIIRWFRSIGYSSTFAPFLYERISEDIFKIKVTSLSQKIWALKRGFLSKKILYFGLTNENYRDYLSDFDYYWLHPINGEYSKWIDDKLTIRYLLNPFSEYLPGYYYHICRNEILRLMDLPDGYQQNISGVINLLRSKHSLAVKPISAAGGEGFYKLAYQNHGFWINNRSSTEMEVEELIDHWLTAKDQEYIITEYIHEHRDLQKLYSEAPGVVRLIIIRNKDQLPRIAYAQMSLAVKEKGLTTNDGVGCRIDINTGRYFDGYGVKDGRFIDHKFHPDSNVLLEGVLPHWSLIMNKIIDVCMYIPQVRYMGLDLIITDEGFKILEINSHPGVFVFQHRHPLLKDGMNKEFFENLLAEKKAVFKR